MTVVDAYPIHCIDIALVRGEESLDGRHLTTPSSPVKRSPAIFILTVHVESFTFNKLLDNESMASLCCFVESS